MITNQLHNTFLVKSSKHLKQFNFFWLGFIIYTLGYTLSQTKHVKFQICGSIQLLGLILLIPPSVTLITFKFENKFLQSIYICYLFWLIFIISRGFSLDPAYIKVTLFDAAYGIFIYCVPLILLFPKELIFYKKIFDVIVIFGIYYLIYDIVFIKDLLYADKSDVSGVFSVANSSLLSIPVCFLLLTFSYHSKKKQILALIVITLALFFAIIWARRGLIFIFLSQIILSYFLYYFNSKKKLFIIFSTLFILLIGTAYVTNYLQKKNNIFGYLMQRGEEDTRTGVEIYFYDDMKDKDWIIGKGINGQYFCPDIDEKHSTYRDVIETGYLQIILKGGLISLGLLLLIAIPAIFKGLFHSKNILSKAAGLWILLWIIYLYPAITEGFYLYYLLVWISIGICYSKKIRNLSEANIKEYFQSTNYKD